MGSTWGNAIKISIFGESHGTGIGVVIDGFPSGVNYDEAFVLREMERRAPGRNKQSTARKEPDRPEIQSGIYNGKTTGTPICAVIRNTNQRSNDYAELAAQPRPGHADYTGMLRYDSCNDPRGGGHFSGRLTAPLVFAGALCKLWLKEQGVTVGSHIQSIAQIQDMPFDDVEVTTEQLDALRNAEYPVNNPRALEAMLAAIEEAREEQDSVGGVIECAAVGLPAVSAARCSTAWKAACPLSCSACPLSRAWNSAQALPSLLCAARTQTTRFMRKTGLSRPKPTTTAASSAASRAACRSSYARASSPRRPSAWCRIRSTSAPARSNRCPSTDGTTRASSPAPRQWLRPPGAVALADLLREAKGYHA